MTQKAQDETLTADRLREVLHYDPKTGQWTRKIDVRKGRFPAGSKAGTRDPRGYWFIWIDGICYSAHRLAFFYMTGEWPKGDIDHIDTDKSNCRWSNLREANKSLNNANAPLRKDNTSGFKGVTWAKNVNKWAVQLVAKGKKYPVKYFENIEDAKKFNEDQRRAAFGEYSRTE
jgi:hypothetical protein